MYVENKLHQKGAERTPGSYRYNVVGLAEGEVISNGEMGGPGVWPGYTDRLLEAWERDLCHRLQSPWLAHMLD